MPVINITHQEAIASRVVALDAPKPTQAMCYTEPAVTPGVPFSCSLLSPSPTKLNFAEFPKILGILEFNSEIKKHSRAQVCVEGRSSSQIPMTFLLGESPCNRTAAYQPREMRMLPSD